MRYRNTVPGSIPLMKYLGMVMSSIEGNDVEEEA
jgi:hypothetical protein